MHLILRLPRANRGPMLLKLISWRHCPYFRWAPYIPWTTAQTLDVELGPSQVTCNKNRNRTTASVTPWKPCSETLFQLHNPYPRSTQNIDTVSSINFPNLSVSC